MSIIKRLIALAVLALVLLAGMLFTVQNDINVPLDLLFIQLPEMYLAFWVIIAFIVGALVGMGISGFALGVLRGRAALLRRKLSKTNQELNKLRQQQQSRLPASKS